MKDKKKLEEIFNKLSEIINDLSRIEQEFSKIKTLSQEHQTNIRDLTRAILENDREGIGLMLFDVIIDSHEIQKQMRELSHLLTNVLDRLRKVNIDLSVEAFIKEERGDNLE